MAWPRYAHAALAVGGLPPRLLGKHEVLLSELIREAVDALAKQFDVRIRLEKVRAARGIWRDRTDLPDLRPCAASGTASLRRKAEWRA
jgi:hypothetical protein